MEGRDATFSQQLSEQVITVETANLMLLKGASVGGNHR